MFDAFLFISRKCRFFLIPRDGVLLLFKYYAARVGQYHLHFTVIPSVAEESCENECVGLITRRLFIKITLNGALYKMYKKKQRAEK